MVEYLFEDAVSFIGELVGIFMDERSGHDNYMTFFRLLNVTTPLLLMNDYRIAR